jgi:hypothetical protein
MNWLLVTMELRHTQLAPVSKTQIVYHPERNRNIRILWGCRFDSEFDFQFEIQP